jgi:hypothetical protein
MSAVSQAKKMFEERAKAGSTAEKRPSHTREKSTTDMLFVQSGTADPQSSDNTPTDSSQYMKKIKDLEIIISELTDERNHLAIENKSYQKDIENLTEKLKGLSTDTGNSERMSELEGQLWDKTKEVETLKAMKVGGSEDVRILEENERLRADRDRITAEISLRKDQIYDLNEEKKTLQVYISQLECDLNAKSDKDKGITDTCDVDKTLYSEGFLIFKKLKTFYTGLIDLEKSKLTKADITLEKYESMITQECKSSAYSVVTQMSSDIITFINQTVLMLKDEIEKLNRIIETKLKMISESSVSYSQDEISTSLGIETNKVKNREEEISQWEKTLLEIQQLSI